MQSGTEQKVLHLCTSHSVSREEIRRRRDEVAHVMVWIMFPQEEKKWILYNGDAGINNNNNKKKRTRENQD